jgi:hypothetical protein
VPAHSRPHILLRQTVREPDVQDLIQSALWPRRILVIVLKLEKLFRCEGIARSIETN